MRDPFEGYHLSSNRFGTGLYNTSERFLDAVPLAFSAFRSSSNKFKTRFLNSPEDDLTWQFYYLSDRHSPKSAITECLTLNGIDPDTVTLAMVNALLFDPGHLILINTPPESAKRSQDEPATLGEVIGAIATGTESIQEAIQVS